MNERERFEKWMNRKGYLHMYPLRFESWQARAEIAKQDEKELIEVLISLRKCGPDETLTHEYIEAIIEKHTGKTWEELNG